MTETDGPPQLPPADRLTRSRLYDLVWSKPLNATAKELGVTRPALKVLCECNQIPIPPVGYWAKKRGGKPVRRKPLPTKDLGEHRLVDEVPKSQIAPPPVLKIPDLIVGDLHDLMWTESTEAVAGKLGCDPAWLVEFCGYSGIPIPGPGYLKKRRAGERVNVRGLAQGLDWRDEVAVLMSKQRAGVPAVPEFVLDADVVELIAAVDRLAIQVAPPDSKRKLHPAVKATRALMRRHARDQWPSRFNRIKRREPYPEPVFVAEVGKASVGRATQLLQALVDAVLALGGSIDVSRGDVVGVVLLGELHRFRIRERLVRHRETDDSGNVVAEVWRPTGILELHLEEWSDSTLLSKWEDGSEPLELKLPAILVSFAKLAQKTRSRNTARRQAEEQKQREKEARRKVAEDAERARHRAGALTGLAEEYDTYIKVRRLLLACEHDGPMSEDAEAWLRSAKNAAESLNVLAGGVGSLRDSVEKRIDEKMRSWHYYDWNY